MNTTLNFTQSNDSLPDNSKLNANSSEILSVKFATFDQEPMTSPSTEYTDSASETSSELKRSNSNSPRYCLESPSFENVAYETKETSSMIQEAGSPHSTKPSDTAANEEIEEEDEDQEENSEELEDWNERRDKVLKNLASKCKYDWKKIAKKFNTSENTQITPLDLKKKYKDLTKVAIPLRVKFSHQEDLMIAKYFELYGCDWARIATYFNDRTAMMLKNRYYSHIRKKNLLASMLEEVKENGGDDIIEAAATSSFETTTEEISMVKIETKIEESAVKFTEQEEESSYLFDDFMSYPYRRFAMTAFNPIFYEFENAIPNVLYDRITLSQY